MHKLFIVIPIADNDGRQYDSVLWDEIHVTLRNLYNSFTRTRVEGSWRDSDGAVFDDVSYRYEMLTDKPLGELATLARHLGYCLNQRKMLIGQEPIDETRCV